MTIAFIPARGGSKRIPRKNIRPFAGKPLIAWPIGAALDSGVFSQVMVSTDDAEIAEVARAYGASVPRLRDADLANDVATISEVISSEIAQLKLTEDICLIYATAAGLSPERLIEGKSRFDASDAEFVMGVTAYPHPVQRAVRLTEDRVAMASPEYQNVRTQDLEPLYHDAAQFVFGRNASWAAGASVWNRPTEGVVLPNYEAFDIDTPEDWERSERLMRLLTM